MRGVLFCLLVPIDDSVERLRSSLNESGHGRHVETAANASDWGMVLLCVFVCPSSRYRATALCAAACFFVGSCVSASNPNGNAGSRGARS